MKDFILLNALWPAVKEFFIDGFHKGIILIACFALIAGTGYIFGLFCTRDRRRKRRQERRMQRHARKAAKLQTNR